MRKRLAFISSIIGLISKISTILVSFVIARFFMRYLGVEVSGINGVFSNVIGFLQLAELGIGSAIIYALYRPLVEDNTKEVQILMRYYKNIYRGIGCIILVVGGILTPFVHVFVHDTTYNNQYIMIVFMIQVVASASTYFLAYKRNLMYADQKQYISTAIDATVNIISGIIRVYVMIHTGSYIIYLIVQVAQNIVSNICVNIWCNRQYPYINEKVTDKYEDMPKLISNVKNLMIGKLGGWVYNSTDNIIISSFVGVITVGLMANYYTLSKMIKTLVDAVVQPIQPMIGRYVCEIKDEKKSFDLFLAYTFVRYCIASIVTVGFIVMANPVVSIWIGKEFTIDISLVVLLSIDTFISITHGPTGEFVNALGLFKNDRNMSIVGMLINLVTSLALVFPLGAKGVLIGTVFAQCYYWIARAHIVFNQYFHEGVRIYVFKVIKYCITTALGVFICDYCFENIFGNNESILTLVIKIILTCIITAILVLTTNFKTKEFQYTVELVKENITRR